MAYLYEYSDPAARPVSTPKHEQQGIKLADLVGVGDDELRLIINLLAPDLAASK